MSLALKLYLAKARRDGALAGERDDDQNGKRLARPAGSLIWLHVSNAEETAPVQELIRYLAEERDDVSFLVTTPNRLQVDARFQDSCDQPCLHVPAPKDTPQDARGFLQHWTPSLLVWAGSTLRPSLLTECRDFGMPMLLADARSRARIDGRKRWNNALAKPLLGLFDHILTGKDVIARRLIRQGAPAEKIDILGMLEEGATTLYCDDRERDEMAAILAGRPVWLATFVDEAEEKAVTEAHRIASRLSHRLLLILAPQDPERGYELAQNLANEGWIFTRRSLGQMPEEHVQIYIADTEDELGLWLRLAPVCFIGNSLTKNAKGFSPFEASALGSAILHGPHVDRYRTGYARLDAADAAREVRDANQLAANVQFLLAPDKAAAMAHAGWEIATSGAEAADRTAEMIIATLEQVEAG